MITSRSRVTMRAYSFTLRRANSISKISTRLTAPSSMASVSRVCAVPPRTVPASYRCRRVGSEVSPWRVRHRSRRRVRSHSRKGAYSSLVPRSDSIACGCTSRYRMTRSNLNSPRSRNRTRTRSRSRSRRIHPPFLLPHPRCHPPHPARSISHPHRRRQCRLYRTVHRQR